MMHCMAAAHIGFACAADKWMSIDGQLIIYTRVTRAILCVVHSSHTSLTHIRTTKPVLSVASFALLRARLPRVNKVSYTCL